MNEPSNTKCHRQCDRQKLDQFLTSDQYRLEDNELIEHLDSCTECRSYLAQQAAAPELWQKTEKLLKPTEFDVANSADCSAATIDHVGQKPVAVQDVLDTLAPTDNPHHLGRLGSYEVTGVVGVGGMGVVLKAIDPSLDRVVAVKVMAPQWAGNEKARKRFAREAKAAAAVIHPNVIPIHSVSSEGSLPYLVMAYIRGGSLQKRLEQQGPLPTVEVLRIGSQVAAGLAAAHEQGLVHRDIKPENILMEEGIERITITDFGLARAVDDNTVTQMGTIAGTPMYMSPEQAQGEHLDQKSDLFSLGCVLYALCTGHPPFRADTSFGVMRMIIDEEPKAIRDLNPEVPIWLAKFVIKLMAKDKHQRFESADEVHKLLEQCLSQTQQNDQWTAIEQMEFLRHIAWPTVTKPSKQSENTQDSQFAKWSLILTATVLMVAAGTFGFLQFFGSGKLNTAKQDLQNYFQSGAGNEYSGKLANELMGSSQGRNYLRAMDKEFDQLAYFEGDLTRGISAVAALLTDDRVEPAQPELHFITWGDEGAVGTTISFPRQICVSSIRFVGASLYDSRVEFDYTASVHPNDRTELEEFFELTPGNRYRVDVALADMLDKRTDWIQIWKDGTFISDEMQSESNNRIFAQRFDEDRRELTAALISAIITALDMHKVLNQDYPSMKEGLQVLTEQQLVKGQEQESRSLLVDPWGNPYGYQNPGSHGTKPDVWSNGPDGKTNTEDDIRSWDLPALPRSKQDHAKSVDDVKNIQGTWKVTYVEDSGRVGQIQQPDGQEIDTQFVFDGSKLTMVMNGQSNEANFSLAPRTTPKWINITQGDRTKPGIYELEGDTLRICLSEGNDQRPTAFDSQPDSPNDLIFLLKRVQEDDTPTALPPKDGEKPSAEYVLTLIPKAASVSNEDFQTLVTSSNPAPLENEPLSLVLISFPAANDEIPAEDDIRFLVDTIQPRDLIAAMSPSKSKGYYSLIQREYIKECKIEAEGGDEDTVFGHVKFIAPDLYEGKVNFRVRKIEGIWKIDQFTLPNRDIQLERNDDGTWSVVEDTCTNTPKLTKL